MASTVQELKDKGLVNPPAWLPQNVAYETIMGSVAYGVSDDTSDMDVYGFCFPKKEMVFPHLAGEIFGFGTQIKRFEQYQEHHIKAEPKEYDLTIYSIVKYFQLCMENNPNIVDSLFTPQRCVLHITHVGNMVRDNRKLFLHKGAWHKFKGYSYSQMHKMSTKVPEGKRADLIKKHGFDVKFGYHVVRLLSEVEQILNEGDLDLQENGRREHMKAIRAGEVSKEHIEKWFSEKELQLEAAYSNSKLPHTPDEPRIKQLLLDCLEHQYGNLEKAVVVPDIHKHALQEMMAVLQKYEGKL